MMREYRIVGRADTVFSSQYQLQFMFIRRRRKEF